MKHRWVSMRYVDEDGRVTDMVNCVNCGFTTTWTNVDIGSPIPRKTETEQDCGDRIVRRVMEG